MYVLATQKRLINPGITVSFLVETESETIIGNQLVSFVYFDYFWGSVCFFVSFVYFWGSVCFFCFFCFFFRLFVPFSTPSFLLFLFVSFCFFCISFTNYPLLLPTLLPLLIVSRGTLRNAIWCNHIEYTNKVQCDATSYNAMCNVALCRKMRCNTFCSDTDYSGIDYDASQYDTVYNVIIVK